MGGFIESYVRVGKRATRIQKGHREDDGVFRLLQLREMRSDVQQKKECMVFVTKSQGYGYSTIKIILIITSTIKLPITILFLFCMIFNIQFISNALRMSRHNIFLQ